VEEQAPLGRWGTGGPGLDERTLEFSRSWLGPPALVPGQQGAQGGRVRPGREPGGGWASFVSGVQIRNDDDTRAAHSRGMSYVDLLTWRSDDAQLPAVDAVAMPVDHDQVQAVVEQCARSGVVVVPVGGGTSVSGAISLVDDAQRDDRPVLAISMAQMNALVDLDPQSAIVTVQAGITGPALERALVARANSDSSHGEFTLGHFPQSWERATVGGFIAARSSGQSSGGYGRIEDMLISAQLATPKGSWTVGGYPAASTGPDLRHLVLGSEGTLGVITSAQLRVRPAPTIRRFAAAIVPQDGAAQGFTAGLDIARELTRSVHRPTVLRVSDAAESHALMAMSAPTGARAIAVNAYLRARKARRGSLVILGWEGTDASDVSAARAFARSVIGDAGGVWLGAGPGRAWERGRFQGPFLRDDLMDAGYLVETVETVAAWSKLENVHTCVTQAARNALGPDSYVMAHISHTYETGASLYFTLLAGASADPHQAAQRWREAKAAITDAIANSGGALSHHHGIGRDLRSWLPGHLGPVGIDVLAAVKDAVDPHGVMNPGALIGDRT